MYNRINQECENELVTLTSNNLDPGVDAMSSVSPNEAIIDEPGVAIMERPGVIDIPNMLAEVSRREPTAKCRNNNTSHIICELWLTKCLKFHQVTKLRWTSCI